MKDEDKDAFGFGCACVAYHKEQKGIAGDIIIVSTSDLASMLAAAYLAGKKATAPAEPTPDQIMRAQAAGVPVAVIVPEDARAATDP